jgi:hypothetical protein
VVPNIGAVDEIIKEEFDERKDKFDNPCILTVADAQDLESAVHPRLAEALGFDPMINTPDFPAGKTVLQDLNGARIVYRVLHSETIRIFTCTIIGSGGQQVEHWLRGSHVGPHPQIDQHGHITNASSLVGEWKSMILANYKDITSHPPAATCPGKQYDPTLVDPARGDAVSELIFAVNLQVEQLEPPP